MTNENSFDRQVKDSLYNYKSPVSSNLWEKIEADKRMRKTIPFWKNGYFLSTLFAVIALTIIATNYRGTNEKMIVSNGTTKANNSVNSLQSNNSISSEKSKIIITNNIGEERNVAVNNNISTKSIESKHSIINKIEINNSQKSLNKVSLKPKAPSTIVDNKIDDIKIAPKTINNIEHNIGSTNTKSGISRSGIRDNQSNNNFNSKISAFTTKQNVDKKMTDKNETLVKKFSSTKENTIAKINEVNNSANSTLADLESYHNEKGQIIPYSTKIRNENMPVTLQKNRNRITVIHVPDILKKNWFLNFYASPDFNTQSIQSNNGLNSFSKFQDSTQRITNGFTAGAIISRDLGNHFQLKTGLQYKQVNERFFYLQNTSKTISVVTNRSYLNNQGATVTILDTTSYQQSGYTIKTVFNSYKSIELPLIVGWEGKIDKLRFAFNTGLITTLYTFFEGKTNDASSNIVPLGATHTNGFYRSVPSFSFYGSGELYYPINNLMDAFAEPYYRFGCSNNITSSVGYNKRYNTAGINLGIRYRFKTSGNK